jgi:hypothetical protein
MIAVVVALLAALRSTLRSRADLRDLIRQMQAANPL